MLISQIAKLLRQAISPVVRTNPAPEEEFKDAEFYIKQGREFFLKGDFKQALACFNRAIDLDLNSAEAYYNRGLLYHSQDNYDKAMIDYERTIRLDPKLFDARLKLGLAYLAKGNDGFALAKFKELITVAPNFVQAYIERGNIYQARAEYDLAITDYDIAIKLDPDLAIAYYNRGSVYQAKKIYDRAIGNYDIAIKLDPSLAVAYYKRGILHNIQKNQDQARVDHNRAFQLNPDIAIDYYIDLGNACLEAGNYDEAISHYDCLMQYTPQNSSSELSSKISSAYANRELAYCYQEITDLDALKLLLPDFNNKERFIIESDWLDNLQKATKQTGNSQIVSLENYSRSCWNEMLESRKYQISSEGRVEVMASGELEKLINLTSVRFVQEGVKPPGVFIRFQFKGGRLIGVVKINPDGSPQGFHSRSGNRLFQAIIDAIALSYFRDLVTPGKEYFYRPTGLPGKGKQPSRKPRTIPRPQNKPISWLQQRVSISDWQEFHVDGFQRKLPKGQKASPEKYQESLDFLGIPLRPGHTYVNAYDRGAARDLTQRFLCSPPDQASKELKRLIQQLN